MVFQMKPKAFSNRVPTEEWCRELESITQWPFQYFWAELNGDETNDLVLVFASNDGDSFDLTGFLTQVREYRYQIWYTENAMPYVQYEQEKSGLYMALEEVGYIPYSEACDGYNDEAISSVSYNDDKTWNVKRPPRPRKSQRYSEPCKYKYNCILGVNCHYQHSNDQKRFFRTNQGKGNQFRKVRPCKHHPNCKNDINECTYAHGEEDAWCLNCSDTCGHYTDNCPKRKTS